VTDDGDSDMEEPTTTTAGKYFVDYQALLEKCRNFMCDDIPQVTPLPLKNRVFSSFCEPLEEKWMVNYIPIGNPV
jgi:hypothetical protein